MTVGELIEKLQKCHPNTPLLVAKDWEGNSFRPSTDVQWGLFDSDYEVGDPDDEDCKEYIVLWP